MNIPRHTFEFDAPGSHLLIIGGIHGDEYEPVAAIHQLINHFQPHNRKDLGSLSGKLTLVPVANLSAYHRGQRCGDDGLDLARTFPGDSNGSVTQRAAFELTSLIAESDLLIDLHTGGTDLSVAPLCGYMMHAMPDVLNQQRRMARAFNLPVVWGTSSELDGRSLSAARDVNVPAMYCEYLGSATCSRAGVQAYVDGCLNVMAEFGMLYRDLPPDVIQLTVEDPRPSSGHLQICNLAPFDGLFQASVVLGQSVHAGDIIGQLLDVVNGTKQDILTQQDGIVLVLRTFPGVKQGQSLFVILETSDSEAIAF